MKKKQMLATLVMLSLLQGSVYAADPEVNNIYYGNGNPVIIDERFTDANTDIIGIGSKTATGNITGGNITVNGGVMHDVIGGAGCGNAVISNNNITVNNITVNGGDIDILAGGLLAGGYSFGKDPYKTSEVKNNTVKIENVTLNTNGIYGGIAEGDIAVYEDVNGDMGFTSSDNSVFNNYVLIDNADLNDMEIAGGVAVYGSAFNNHVEINGGTLKDLTVYGGLGEGVTGNVYGNSVTINAVEGSLENQIVVYGGSMRNGNVNKNIVNIYKSEIGGVFGGFTEVENGLGYFCDISQNGIVIKNATVYVAVGGICYNKNYKPDAAKVHDNYVVVGAGGNVTINLVAGVVTGAPADVINNKIILCENSTVTGTVIAGGSDNIKSEISGNSINLLKNADVSKANLYGYRFGEDLGAVSSDKVSNNNLVIDKGWSGSTLSVQNFNNINFENIKWSNGGTVLNITENSENGALANTKINHDNVVFSGGTKLKTGDSMILVAGDNLDISADNVSTAGNFTAGVSIEGTGTAEVADDGNSVKYTLTEVKQNSQIDLVAKNRAVAAAFVNQGTDLIADSLDTLSRDGKYGVKTFAAVHGNRSKYDVNSDIKINGWSTIVGVGAENEHHGGDFSWGVFYENGSGNYRTYNDFNNEFFRGDGSLVYNGGGIAARYENSHGVYTEGSLRAGMLKSEMTDALSDGENKYGYESETAYYGAHIGVGKIFSLGDDSDLDVYGKFFHTYTEGDSFNVAGDEFEFDSINSDRLRIGARVTSNKENKFSTYYGLAYEYEFNGDAEMRAAGMKAPTQSLQGSSVMAEIGLNYQPTPDSPWSFDLNMRGYAGERQGGSFNVQATYTF